MKPADLNRQHVYITPLGRRCMLTVSKENTASRELFTFVYLNEQGGFSMTLGNLKHLQREHTHVAPTR
jgi:hypothetical protein